jgi:hypothetical protein
MARASCPYRPASVAKLVAALRARGIEDEVTIARDGTIHIGKAAVEMQDKLDRELEEFNARHGQG